MFICCTTQIGKHPIDDHRHTAKLFRNRPHGQSIEHLLDRHFPNQPACPHVGVAVCWRALSKLLSTHQIGIAKRRRLCLICHLLEGVGLQVAGGLVGWVSEHQVIHHFRNPAVVATIKRLLRMRKECTGATG